MRQGTCSCLNCWREVLAINRVALKRALHILDKKRLVLSHGLGGLVVKRVIRVRLYKKNNETIDDCINIKHRFPVRTKNVEADITLIVNVRVVDLFDALHLGRFVRVHVRYCELECVAETFPVAIIRRDHNLKVHKVIWVREVGLSAVSAIKLRYVLLYTNLTRTQTTTSLLGGLGAFDSKDIHTATTTTATTTSTRLCIVAITHADHIVARFTFVAICCRRFLALTRDLRFIINCSGGFRLGKCLRGLLLLFLFHNSNHRPERRFCERMIDNSVSRPKEQIDKGTIGVSQN
mmetsp:Transcript_14991/g.29182  ORF Transcript_14991/g.29182 Transcript_14991/m.29182 type:complete len:292 (+) Transcript_14991:73-948(+)